MGMNMVGTLVGSAETAKAYLKPLRAPKGTIRRPEQILTNFKL